MRLLSSRQPLPTRVSGLAAAARSAPVALPVVIAAAWVTAAAAELSGNAGVLHHHALIENGPPLLVAAPVFLLGWQVMIAAMMLPASLPAIAMFGARASIPVRPRPALAVFLGSFALVWTAFGLLAFLGDVVLHHVVDATPWLAARPWLVEASVVALAGVYQLVPLKGRALETCRHPVSLGPDVATGRSDPFRLGIEHGVACLGSSWALMLLMFGEGFANLTWMAALTAVMVYETTGRRGRRAATIVGALLLVGAAAIVLTGRGSV